MIFARTSTGSSPELNIRQIILAQSPVPLCLAERIVQAVLRGNPNTFACAFSETNPAVISASPISRILDDCRAFSSRSGLRDGERRIRRDADYRSACEPAATPEPAHAYWATPLRALVRCLVPPDSQSDHATPHVAITPLRHRCLANDRKARNCLRASRLWADHKNRNRTAL